MIAKQLDQTAEPGARMALLQAMSDPLQKADALIRADIEESTDSPDFLADTGDDSRRLGVHPTTS